MKAGFVGPGLCFLREESDMTKRSAFKAAWAVAIAIVLFVSTAVAQRQGGAAGGNVAISGELRQWHKVTLTLTGPESDETASPNPFLDYRLSITFTHASGAPVYTVPGYFAADGNAATSSATSGNKWRAHFAPDKTGR